MIHLVSDGYCGFKLNLYQHFGSFSLGRYLISCSQNTRIILYNINQLESDFLFRGIPRAILCRLIID